MDSSLPPPLPGSVPTPAPPPRNWWQRNWKWFVPTGCLSLLAFFVLFVAAIFSAVFGMMKSSDAYKTALHRAKTNPQVIEEIGQPIKAGWFVSGSTHVTGDSGESDITIPIHGPKGAAKIYAVAKKSEGTWEYSKLTVKVEKTGDSIDLTEEEPEE